MQARYETRMLHEILKRLASLESRLANAERHIAELEEAQTTIHSLRMEPLLKPEAPCLPPYRPFFGTGLLAEGHTHAAIAAGAAPLLRR